VDAGLRIEPWGSVIHAMQVKTADAASSAFSKPGHKKVRLPPSHVIGSFNSELISSFVNL
jgi:hypothetical protein